MDTYFTHANCVCAYISEQVYVCICKWMCVCVQAVYAKLTTFTAHDHVRSEI